MSSNHEQPQGSWSSAGEGNDGPSSYSNYQIPPAATPRQPLSRRESRNAGNWPDASPLHHNEGTSYFQNQQGGRVSPTLNRRIQHTASAPTGPSTSYQQRPASQRHSHSQHRSASISSARLRRRDTALSEEEEDDDEDDGERFDSREGRRTPLPRPDDDPSSSDDPDAEAARALDGESDSGSLDPVTL